MIEERVVVSAVDGLYVWIDSQRQSTCGQCSVNKGCGTAVLNGVLGAKRTRIRVRSEIVGLAPGEAVIVGMRDAAMIESAVAFFGVPIVLMLLMAIFGSWTIGQLGISVGEGSRVLLGFVGLVLGIVWTWQWAKRKERDGRHDLRVLRRAPAVRSFVQIVKRD